MSLTRTRDACIAVMVCVLLSAAGVVNAAEQRRPFGNEQARRLLEMTYSLGGSKSAAEIAVKICAEPGVDAEIPLSYAFRMYSVDKDMESASTVLRAVLARPDTADRNSIVRSTTLGLLAAVFIHQRKFAEAVDLLEPDLLQGVGSPLAFYVLADAYDGVGRAQDAHRMYLVAMSMDPGDPKPWAALEQHKETLQRLVDAPGKTFPQHHDRKLALQVMAHGEPKTWTFGDLPGITQTYAALVKAHLDAKRADAAELVQNAFLNRLWEFLGAKFEESRWEDVLAVLSNIEQVQPRQEMVAPRKKSFLFRLAAANIYLHEPLAAARTLEELEQSPQSLLLTYDKDGKLISHLVLKLARMNLRSAFNSISWDPRTHQLINADARDFVGHFFNVEPSDAQLQSGLLVTARFVSENHEDTEVFHLMPYGAVSEDEDWVTIATCLRGRQLIDAKILGDDEPSALTFFCGGARVFPSFIKGGPPFPPHPNFQGALDWSIEQGSFDLPVKSMIVRLDKSCDDRFVTHAPETVVSPKELDRLETEMRKAGPDKLNTATTEAFEVTRITFGILSRLRQARPGPSDNEKPGGE